MHVTKRKYTRRVQFYDPEVNENITKQSWDVIPIPDTVIDWVNLLVKYLQEILVFTDRRGRTIGDGDVELVVVDGAGDENESPLKIQNKNYLNYQEDQVEVHPEQ